MKRYLIIGLLVNSQLSFALGSNEISNVDKQVNITTSYALALGMMTAGIVAIAPEGVCSGEDQGATVVRKVTGVTLLAIGGGILGYVIAKDYAAQCMSKTIKKI